MTQEALKFKKSDIPAIVEEAFRKAKEAAIKYHNTYGDRDACGFAWVVIRPANCNMAKYLVEIGKAEKHYAGGVSVWDPGKIPTQSISTKEAGARAFAAHLAQYGIKVEWSSNMD